MSPRRSTARTDHVAEGVPPVLHRDLDRARGVHGRLGDGRVPRCARGQLPADRGRQRGGRHRARDLRREVPEESEAALMACPGCFGDSNEPMALATNLGIWFMLGVVVAMLSAFASFFIYLMRRARRFEQETGTADAGFSAGREGTAQC